VYRALTPTGDLKNEPDLVDAGQGWAPGCAVDVSTGDLHTTGFDTMSIWQDEPTQTNGSGNTISDGKGIGTSVASVRAERTGVKATPGDGRIYQINFTASDGKTGGTCTGSVLVGIPHDQGGSSMPIDKGIRYDSITGAIR